MARFPGPVAVLGAGATATALAGGLVRAGVPVRIWARRASASRSLVSRLRRYSRRARLERVARLAELVDAPTAIVCVTDRAVGEVAERLAASGPPVAGAVVLHTSGYFDETPLAPLTRLGPRRWSAGSLHPLVALRPRAKGAQALEGLRGAWYATSGGPPARRRGRELIAVLGGNELRLAAGAPAKERYHAAAALLAGGLVALFDAAFETLGDAARSSREARAAFVQLAASTLDNLAQVPPGDALTGPAARGDAEVVAGHLELLGRGRGRFPAGTAPELYRALSARMLAMAEERGRLSRRARREIDRLLRS